MDANPSPRASVHDRQSAARRGDDCPSELRASPEATGETAQMESLGLSSPAVSADYGKEVISSDPQVLRPFGSSNLSEYLSPSRGPQRISRKISTFRIPHLRNRTSSLPAAVAMTHAMHRSAAYRGKPAVAETIHGAHVPTAVRNSARALEAVAAMRNRALALSNCALAVSNCALAVSVLRMGVVPILRCFVRSTGAAHELAQIETSIMGDLSPTLTRSES